jgi:hypothetical protein
MGKVNECQISWKGYRDSSSGAEQYWECKQSKNLREQLAARHVTDAAIPNQVLPVTAIDVENISQSISESMTSAGH